MPRSSRSLIPILLTSTWLFLLPHNAIAGKLDRISDAARSSGSSSSSSSSSSNSSSSSGSSYESSSSCSSCGDSDGQGLMLIVLAITSPWWGPAAAIEPSNPNYTVGFPPYPYETSEAGSMIVDGEPPASEVPPAPEQPKRKWALQLGAESGYVFDRVWREGLNLRFQTAYRIEFDANWSLFMEREPGAFTNLVLGREHVIWRHAQSSAMQFHTSLGAQHLIDSKGDLSGIDFAYGFEVYPARPLTLAVEGALGNLGSAFAPRVRATVGFVHSRFELLFGYEHQWIGSETLGGPFAGLRLWL